MNSPRTVPAPGVSPGNSNVNGLNGHLGPYGGRLGSIVNRRYIAAVIGDGGRGSGGGLSTRVYAHSTGTWGASGG